MYWIEIDGILVNLNTITTISMFDKTVRLWIVSETIPFDVKFDTEEQAKAWYEKIKGALPLLQICETKNECIDEQTCNDEYEMLAKMFDRGPEVSD